MKRFLALVLLIVPIASSEEPVGTFSIVAFDPITHELGVAVQSRAFSVGAGVPWAEAGVGAIATQASTNESFGPRGLALMRAGHSASETLEMLIHSDDGREDRQLGVVDARGASASWTGKACLDWAGHRTAPGLSIQGNILAAEAVIEAMESAFESTEGELAERLIAALHAAQAAGGDKRGQQSAGLLVVRPSDRYPEYRHRYIELRVEDHPSPIIELERVFRIHQASDLLEAHLRYAEAYDEAGEAQLAALERQRVGEAIEYALSDSQTSASTLNAMAWYAAAAGAELDRALAAASRAVELEPDNSGILDTLAEVQFTRGELEAALATIDRALTLEPDSEYLKSQRARFVDPSR